MRSFMIALEGDGFGEPRNIEFEADGPHQVFSILEREDLGTFAVLWEGEKRLAMLRRIYIGGWELMP